MEIKKDTQTGHYVLDFDFDEFEDMGTVFAIASDNDSYSMSDKFTLWCRKNSQRIFKILYN